MAARDNRFDFPPTGKTHGQLDLSPTPITSTRASMRNSCGARRAAGRRRGPRARCATSSRTRETGDIRALIMESGERIAGDFFIDCSGFRSLLLAGKLGVDWDDWSQWLAVRPRPAGADRATAASSRPTRASRAMDAGWRWRIPLQHRTGNGYVFSSRFIDEDKAREELLAEPRRAAACRAAAAASSRPGRRVSSWQRNCVALGLSSGFLEPLESTSIYLIQIAHHAPACRCCRRKQHDQRLVDEFNLRMDIEYERIRDFLILHYHLNSRDDTELWRYCRSMEVPDSLQRKHAAVPPLRRGRAVSRRTVHAAELAQRVTSGRA